MTDPSSEAPPDRLQAIIDRLLPIAQMYVDAFRDDETMSFGARLRLQEIQDILADPDGWTPERPIGYTTPEERLREQIQHYEGLCQDPDALEALARQRRRQQSGGGESPAAPTGADQ